MFHIVVASKSRSRKLHLIVEYPPNLSIPVTSVSIRILLSHLPSYTPYLTSSLTLQLCLDPSTQIVNT